jgi:phage gp45-like
VEKKEAFPYGFCAKAKTGRVFVFCQGGNFDGFEILPLVADEGAALPELEENDAALYTENGGSIICREKGAVEINGKEKHFVTFEDLNKAVSAFMQGLNAHTHPASGSPPSAPMGFDISAAKTETVKTS